jgi:ABC-type uncharacterized transport system permease subunit
VTGAQTPLPCWVDIVLIPLANVTLAFLVAGLIVLAIGENPLLAIRVMIAGALGDSEGVGYTLYYATNFIFTGLAVALAFHAGLFNIGGEGQAYIGGLGIGLVLLAGGRYLSFSVLLPLAVLAGAGFGAAWALVLIAPGSMSPESREFGPAAHLPFIHDVLASIGIKLTGTPLNLSLVLAIALCVFVWLLLWHTPLGFELRTVGHSETAAVYAGVRPRRIIIIAMCLSGAMAGFVGLNEIMGVHHRLLLNFTAGYGFTGIAVALMGRNHPFGIILASILFGILSQGGTELAFTIPTLTRDMIVVIQGLVILFSGALSQLSRPWFEWLFSLLQRQAPAVRGA